MTCPFSAIVAIYIYIFDFDVLLHLPAIQRRFQPLNNVSKLSILNVCSGPGYSSEHKYSICNFFLVTIILNMDQIWKYVDCNKYNLNNKALHLVSILPQTTQENQVFT